MFAGLGEKTAAWLACVFFFIIAALHPLNGVYFILLAVPFFLGSSKRPFYLLLEFFIYSTILSGGIHYLIKKPELKLTKFFIPVLVFAAVSILAIPLNFKEIIWDLRVWQPIETLRALASAHEGSNMYYFRALLNSLSAVMMFFVVIAFTRNEKDITRIFKPILLMLFANALFAYLLNYRIPGWGSYLGLSLFGWHGSGASAFAYNRGYLSQYLAVFYPAAFYFILNDEHRNLTRGGCVLLLLIVFAAMALTLQRISGIIVFGQFLVLGIIFTRISHKSKRDISIILSGFLSLIGIYFLADYYFLSGTGIQRIISEGIGPRIELWQVCREMFLRNPLLGLGQGRFLLSFREYCGYAGVSFEEIQFMRTTAHNVYLHILSEQGILGLGAFLLIIWTVFFYSFKHIKDLRKAKQLVLISICLSLTGWILYGLTQHTFYVRSIGLSFWLVLGFAAVIFKDKLPPAGLSRKTKLIMLSVFLLLFAYRAGRIILHPYPENYYAGFHRMEMQPEGRTARWIGKKAVRRMPAEEGNLLLGLKCPTPAVSHRPQEVQITVNGFAKVAILEDTEYKEIIIPGGEIPENFVWIRIKPSYTVNPEKEGWSSDNRYLGVMVYEPVWEESRH